MDLKQMSRQGLYDLIERIEAGETVGGDDDEVPVLEEPTSTSEPEDTELSAELAEEAKRRGVSGGWTTVVVTGLFASL